ncbi:glucose-1-phosphate thymidylyltransferase [Oculatella sp. LEGE 06141]|uniref:glucose-1-phosphate thymidylyltransferase n=1 Tax=Oculatella sp. LEGE 06141 TaxID=1828648 RepID=UPI00188017F9|nr:glucose-1-phosphate thymidylyltransferase [Oculatella sp. LEGE 06141]MBE9178826.1 glucose-1-phosphate thymidylyltransferase [Oculatella sp. LEGE 06141]
MKALILSGGKGKRLRPLTYTGAKQLVPIANQPILWYGIEAIAAAGITDIGIIINPETGEEIEAKTGNGDRFGVTITYLLQANPDGLAHAVKTAQPFLGESPFLLYLGDNLIEADLRLVLDEFTVNQFDALTLLAPIANPSAYGVADLDAEGRLIRFVEKPAVPPSNLALVGIYCFSAAVHAAIATLRPSARGELEITEAIQALIDAGKAVEARHLAGWWIDTGKKDDLLEANRIVLDDRLHPQNLGDVDKQSRIIGRVGIGAGTQVTNCTIRGPVVIGENCRLENCYVGPYSSIGNQVTLIDVDLEYSVVLQGATVIHIHQRIIDSVIGQRAYICSAPPRPKAMRFMIGDDCQIELCH